MMSRRTSLSLAFFVAVLIAAAIFIRADEKGYHQYLAGDYKTTHEALIEQANAGGEFAAYLKGRIENSSLLGPRDTVAALESFRQAAKLGHPDGAIMEFWLAAELAGYTTKACDQLKSLLDLGARARNLKAAAYGGDLHRSRNCGPPDPIMAAGYYGQAARLDRRMGTKLDSLMATLSGDILAQSQQAAQREFQPLRVQAFLDHYHALKTGDLAPAGSLQSR
ncbi:MAG: hypothetical protein VW169_08240 [Rhodospirillaceae bacterium]